MSDPQARLQAARDRFAARLPDRLDALRQAALAARDEPARLAEAIGLAHKLAGTAGSFGRPELGEAAADLERALIAARDGAPDWTAIDAALAAVGAHVV